jgi:zinc protease
MKRTRPTPALAALTALALAGWAAAAPDATPPAAQGPSVKTSSPLPQLPIVEYRLKNGLTVLLSEDHVVPSVATQLVYLVGSGHEVKGKTGFAHLFEHLMFQGSAHFDHDYFTPFEPIGAEVNGNTTPDRTVYYEVVPSQYAELSLWMESDRMRSLLPALTQQKLDNQREVVKNERRQRYEITPYGLAFLHLDTALYPETHPYHHSTIGSHEDLTAATLDDVKKFFETYYVPANAGLVVVGDFEVERMKGLIEQYFGDMAAGARAPAPQVDRPQLAQDVHWVAEDTIQLPSVYLAWITPALFEDGDAELDLLSNVLTQGKSSRLFHSLVYSKKLAKEVYAYQMSERLNGAYVIQATAAPGVDLNVLVEALKQELRSALSTPPTESELSRAKNDYKKGFYHRLESYEARADVIGTYFLHSGHGDYMERDFTRYQTANSLAVQTAGKKYLLEQHFVRLDFVPGSKSTPIKVVSGPQPAPVSEAKP